MEKNEVKVVESTAELPTDLVYFEPVVRRERPEEGFDYIYQRSTGLWLCFKVKCTVEEWRYAVWAAR